MCVLLSSCFPCQRRRLSRRPRRQSPASASASASWSPSSPNHTSAANNSNLVVVPKYREVFRSRCVLLELCWNQNWNDVVRRIHTHPGETFCLTSTQGRSALHLCTMPGTDCPTKVLQTLLEVNPHAVLVHDRHPHGGTPLHLLVGGRHRHNAHLVRLFVDTAMREGTKSNYYIVGQRQVYSAAPPSPFSPLAMACRKEASVETLHALVVARRNDPTNWIAPWTGAEPWHNYNHSTDSLDIGDVHPRPPIDPSPLSELWSHIQDNFNIPLDARMIECLRQYTILMLTACSTCDECEDSSESYPAPPPQSRPLDLQPILDSWLSLLILLRPHVASPNALLHAIVNLRSLNILTTLYPFVGRLFPEQIIVPNQQEEAQDDCNKDNTVGAIPLHVLFFRPTLMVNWWSAPFADIVTSSIALDGQCAVAIEPTTGLPTVLLAAAMRAPTTTIYELVHASNIPYL